MAKRIELCFSPALFPLFETKNSVVVVVDILRATSVITTMFMNGVKEVIPVRDLEEAREYKNKGYLVVAERDGVKLDFADYGNSPFFFTENVVKDMTLVYSTTNGTNAISVGSGARAVLIGSYLNFTALAEKITEMNSDVLLLCAGWKDKYCIEDTVFCGALASKLIEQKTHETNCDSVHCSIDQWKLAEKNILSYIEKAAQRHRLRKIGLDDVIPYCHEFDKTGKVPYFSGNRILSY